MSDFRFAKPAAPRRMVYVAGYGLAAIIALAGVLFWSGTSGSRAAIGDMKTTIARAQALADSPASGLGAEAFYQGDTPQLAQAALQTTLQELAENFDIQIEVIRTDEIEQIDNLVRLNLTLNGVAPEARLGEFLHGLVALEPMVIVEQLNLRRARTSRSDPERRVAFQAQLYGMTGR